MLFCDMRSFTAIADQRLPFDIVFLLNRYFAIIGEAVEKAGGRLDKFIGDGAMALFGLRSAAGRGLPAGACRRRARSSPESARLSDELAGEIRAPVQVAIGIHVGPAIVGTMGYRHDDGRDRDRRHRQHRQPARGGRQGIRRRHRHFRSRREAVRPRLRGSRAARDRHSRPGAAARRLRGGTRHSDTGEALPRGGGPAQAAPPKRDNAQAARTGSSVTL